MSMKEEKNPLDEWMNEWKNEWMIIWMSEWMNAQIAKTVYYRRNASSQVTWKFE